MLRPLFIVALRNPIESFLKSILMNDSFTLAVLGERFKFCRDWKIRKLSQVLGVPQVSQLPNTLKLFEGLKLLKVFSAILLCDRTFNSCLRRTIKYRTGNFQNHLTLIFLLLNLIEDLLRINLIYFSMFLWRAEVDISAFTIYMRVLSEQRIMSSHPVTNRNV